MKRNIYIQTLKLGFENSEGITFNEVVKRLNIELGDLAFRTNYLKWFYANFYNEKAEDKVVGDKVAVNAQFRITQKNIQSFDAINKEKSYIKGDAVNKYIDYLELERTRKAARTAGYVSAISILIAISAIIIPITYDKTPQPPFDVNVLNSPETVKKTEIFIEDTILSSKKEIDENTPKLKGS